VFFQKLLRIETNIAGVSAVAAKVKAVVREAKSVQVKGETTVEAASFVGGGIGYDWLCIGFELGLFRRGRRGNWVCLALFWVCIGFVFLYIVHS